MSDTGARYSMPCDQRKLLAIFSYIFNLYDTLIEYTCAVIRQKDLTLCEDGYEPVKKNKKDS